MVSKKKNPISFLNFLKVIWNGWAKENQAERYFKTLHLSTDEKLVDEVFGYSAGLLGHANWRHKIEERYPSQTFLVPS